MLVSTETGSLRALKDIKKIVQYIKNAGFTAYDFSMFNGLSDDIKFIGSDNYVELAKDLRKFADEIGICCNQAHAPFPTVIKDNDQATQTQHKLIMRAIEVSGILGAKICVVHPYNNYNPEQNAEIYKKFLSVAKSSNVKIGVENMWNWNGRINKAKPCACSLEDNFLKHLSLLDSEVFTACLDIGHAEMFNGKTNCEKLILALDKRLGCLHIHDNDLRNDSHILPYSGKIDYQKMLDALRSVNYQGDITFECDANTGKMPLELYPCYLRYLCDIGNYFRKNLQL